MCCVYCMLSELIHHSNGWSKHSSLGYCTPNDFTQGDSTSHLSVQNCKDHCLTSSTCKAISFKTGDCNLYTIRWLPLWWSCDLCHAMISLLWKWVDLWELLALPRCGRVIVDSNYETWVTDLQSVPDQAAAARCQQTAYGYAPGFVFLCMSWMPVWAHSSMHATSFLARYSRLWFQWEVLRHLETRHQYIHLLQWDVGAPSGDLSRWRH